MKYERPEMEIWQFEKSVGTDIGFGSQEPSSGTGGGNEW